MKKKETSSYIVTFRGGAYSLTFNDVFLIRNTELSVEFINKENQTIFCAPTENIIYYHQIEDLPKPSEETQKLKEELCQLRAKNLDMRNFLESLLQCGVCDRIIHFKGWLVSYLRFKA